MGALPVNTPLFSGNYNDLSDKPVIPTKVSELDNDFGYIVVESDPTVPDWAKQLTKPTYSKAEIGLGNVDNIQQASKSEFDSHSNNNSIHVTDSDKNNWNNKANVGDIPSSISQLDNDEEFIKNTVGNLTNYYLKSETYTRQEVQDLVSSVQSVQIQSVEVLPAIGESNIIYLVPKAGGTANNVKDEYI
ncbi:hypothetical protein [Proteiniphilum acetatigenes]|uniref:hypothetical protein n=1 Tax=Proteiniphilum acetatigenes TaxID=294710 RepID=UPI00036F9E12|nr:hypothetical protein [Proteiniphilum acetatigenes]